MISYFKIPVYLEVESTELDRQKVTDVFNSYILPYYMDVIKGMYLLNEEQANELNPDFTGDMYLKEQGITKVCLLDLKQHLEKIGKVKKT